MTATLHVIEGPDEGRLFNLSESVVTIGRNAENTIVLNDVSVSGVHSKIVRKANGHYTCLDSASTNGTFVNGAEQRAIDLKHGDQIRIGGCTMAFEQHRDSAILPGSGSGEGAIRAEQGTATALGELPDPKKLDRKILEQSYFRSQLLERLDRILSNSEGSTEVLQAVLEAAMSGTEALRGFILMVDGRSGEILPSVASDRSGQTEEISFSKSLALEVVGAGKGVVRLHDDSPVICAPILTGSNGTSGVVYLDFPAGGSFTTSELEVVEGVGRRAGAWIEASNSKVDFDLLFSSMIDAIMKSIQAKDVYTRGHSERVRHYAKLLGKELGLSQDELSRVSLGAGLHDIGKIGMPDSVLKFNKTPRLTAEQMAEVKKHPTRGGQILGDIPFLQDIVPAAELHHEDWDGTGYPHGLAGEDIPLIARIVAVADTYDAITTDRPYQKGKTYEEGHAILRKIAGKRLQPELVEAFVAAFKKYRKVPMGQTRTIKKSTRIKFDVDEALEAAASASATGAVDPESDDLDEGLKSVILIG